MCVDRQLLASLKSNDPKAFRQIFDAYSKRVYHFIQLYVHNAVDAEDITQNVFIKIWSVKGSIDLDKSFEGFLFTIAHRMVIDYFRQHSPTFRSESINKAYENLASTQSTDELLNRHQMESLYQKALQSLPTKRQQIFLLSRHNGLSNKQIADFLHISVKTVENQITAALSALRVFFKDSSIILGIIYFLSA